MSRLLTRKSARYILDERITPAEILVGRTKYENAQANFPSCYVIAAPTQAPMPRLLPFICAACALAGASLAQAQSIYEPYSFTTLAGNPPGSIDGTGSTARFAGLFGVAVDNSGTVYVADSDNNTIRKVVGGGVVTTLAWLEMRAARMAPAVTRDSLAQRALC
jgi:hypothetical protein